MTAGLGILRIPPSEFWRMTPKEFSAAYRGHFNLTSAPSALSRTDLNALMQLFPDAQEAR